MDDFTALGQLDDDAFLSRPGIADDMRNDYGSTLLQWAIVKRRPKVAAELIRRGAPLNIQDPKGATALEYALSRRQPDIAKLLIESGADVNVRDNHGNGPLWRAILTRGVNGDLVQMLAKRGADLDVKNRAGVSVRDLVLEIGDPGLAQAVGIRLDG